MKKPLSFIAISIMIWSVNAQTVFWSEDFTSTGCNPGAAVASFSGTNGPWTLTSTGTNDNYANEWYISATEAYTGANNCGDGCQNNSALTNGTLHLGMTLTTESGAAYFNGGYCGSSICVVTNKRADSPAINCTGFSNISLSFAYLEGGDGVLDDATVWFYDGLTWALLVNTPKTALTCAPQGRWEVLTIAMPASANNNPNVKIGFNWTNNDDQTGTDPSFAVDSIRVMHSTITEIAEKNNAAVKIFSYGQLIIIDSDQSYKVIGVRDLLGRSIPFTKENNILNLNSSQGIYIVHLELNGVNVFRQVVAGNR